MGGAQAGSPVGLHHVRSSYARPGYLVASREAILLAWGCIHHVRRLDYLISKAWERHPLVAYALRMRKGNEPI